MMNPKIRSTLKLISATSVALFSLLAVFTGCFSWFNATRALDANSNSFSVTKIDSAFSALHIHASTSADEDSYVFSSTPIGTITFGADGEAEKDFDEAIEFGQYDPRSPHHPLLFDFELSSSITITESTAISLTATTDRSFVGVNDEDLSPTSNPLSWIIAAYAFSSNAQTIDYSYDVADLGTRKKFVDISNTGGDLAYADFHQTLTLLSPAQNTTLRHIVVVMDYYTDAVEYIYNHYLGSEILDQDNIPFYIDWEFSL